MLQSDICRTLDAWDSDGGPGNGMFLAGVEVVYIYIGRPQVAASSDTFASNHKREPTVNLYVKYSPRHIQPDSSTRWFSATHLQIPPQSSNRIGNQGSFLLCSPRCSSYLAHSSYLALHAKPARSMGQTSRFTRRTSQSPPRLLSYAQG